MARFAVAVIIALIGVFGVTNAQIGVLGGGLGGVAPLGLGGVGLGLGGLGGVGIGGLGLGGLHGGYAVPNYAYSYGVADKLTGDNKQASEVRKGAHTETQYSQSIVHG